MIGPQDKIYLQRCVKLARQALTEGNPPFGSLLVDQNGNILVESYNQVSHGDQTCHPELRIAQWASTHLPACERRKMTTYTSGEHCPMCAAAHGWVGLGRIVYACSSQQLDHWYQAWGIKPSAVKLFPIEDILSHVQVDGPEPDLVAEIKALQKQYLTRKCRLPTHAQDSNDL